MSAILDYATAGVRVAERSLVQRPRLGREERLVFVVGCPRSGTTFVGRAIGGLPGFVDFGEVTPWKAALPHDPSAAELRTILERIRRIGLAWGLRGVEQTPETAHVLDAALEAYPQALAVHAVRDGRDVVCSLLERGWLNADQVGADDARLPYGSQPRFWVEPERREEFAQVSDARRCAWAWRRYVDAVRAANAGDRMLEIRYEALATVADRLAEFLDANAASTHRAMDSFRDSSIGRWRRELTPEQLADVEAEAGPLLAELGYS
ncbi:MAG TPA: sulfotransferase [Gaiellaceae bacterium]|nr:sulfotransferase [Gaiellaceae bacterium]